MSNENVNVVSEVVENSEVVVVSNEPEAISTEVVADVVVEAAQEKPVKKSKSKKKVEEEAPKAAPKVKAKKAQRYVAFSYDIPSPKENSDGTMAAPIFPNPSAVLHPYAVRYNLSCWIVPLARVDTEAFQAILTGMKAVNVNFRIMKWDPTELETILRIAKDELEAQTAEIHGRLITGLDKATKAFNKAEEALQQTLEGVTENARYDLLRRREARQKLALNKAGEMLNAAVECAEVFDVTMNVQDCLDGLRTVVAAQQAAFNLEVEARKSQFPNRHNQSTTSSANRAAVANRGSDEKDSFGSYIGSSNQMVNACLSSTEAKTSSQIIKEANLTQKQFRFSHINRLMAEGFVVRVDRGWMLTTGVVYSVNSVPQEVVTEEVKEEELVTA